MKSHRLTLSQSRIVAFLSEKDGIATQKELEDVLGVSHPTIVGLISRMEQNGIVYTYFDNSCRSKVVKLTDNALALASDMDAAVSKQENIMLDGLSEDEIEALRKALNIILKNID